MNIEKMKMETPDKTDENIEKILALFPDCATEIPDEKGNVKKGVNFEALRQMLSHDIIEGKETYELTWVGKKASIVEAHRPTNRTLRPHPEESVDWDTTENLYIEGENLEVLKLLQGSYQNSIKMIYIDPPYNTGNDFIYRDKFMMSVDEYDKVTGAIDEQKKRYFRNKNLDGRIHSNWCSMIYPRLLLARNLLSDDGVIFISIDNNEFANMKTMCDAVMGEQSFVTVLHVQMSTVQGQKVRAAKAGNIVKNAEYILVYSKNGNKTIGIKPMLDPVKYDNHYNAFLEKISDGIYREQNLSDLVSKEQQVYDELNILNLLQKNGKVSSNSFQKYYESSPAFREFIKANAQRIVRTHDSVDVPKDFKSKMEKGKVYLYKSDSREYYVSLNNNGVVTQRIFLSEKLQTADDFYKTYGPTTIRGDWWAGFYLDMGNVSKEGGVNFDNGKKPVRLIKQLIDFCTTENAIVLDFFSGSATTAHAVMQLNAERLAKSIKEPDLFTEVNYSEKDEKGSKPIPGGIKFIMVQLGEGEECGEETDAYKSGFKTISEIGKERIRRAGKKIKDENPLIAANLDTGFRVLKLDETNMEDVYYTPEATTQDLLAHQNGNIKEDRTDLDLLFGCLLEWKLPLSKPYTEEKIKGLKVLRYDDRSLIACFEEEITEDAVREIAKLHPRVAVFRDGCFGKDQDKINAGEIFKIHSPGTLVKVI